MKRIQFLILFVFLNSTAVVLCQYDYNVSISCTIFTETAKEKLPNANIFFSKTTIGTTSDLEGHFEIKNLQEGNYTLIVSMIGYETYVKKIVIKKDSEITLEIILKPKSVELNTVEVTGDKSEYERYLKEQYKYRKIFKKYFLGQTKFSEKYEITNEEKIVFKKNTLGFIEIECPEPVIIINNALGYKVECLLESFLCNDYNGSVQMLFFPKFIELKADDEEQIETWKENRKSTYLSSQCRFLLSVINNKVQDKGYGLYLTNTNFNIREIPRAKLLYGSENISEIDSVTSEIKLSFKGFLLVYNIMTQEDSWIKLPSGEAKLNYDGYVEDHLNMSVYNTFAKQGVADLLPDNLVYDY